MLSQQEKFKKQVINKIKVPKSARKEIKKITSSIRKKTAPALGKKDIVHGSKQERKKSIQRHERKLYKRVKSGQDVGKHSGKKIMKKLYGE